jgi:hypothetical protein
MPDLIDRLIGLSADELKAWRSKRRARGPYKKKERPKRTKEQLSNYLIKNNYRTRAQLVNGRKEGDPTPDDYKKEYGNWTNAVTEIFNIEPLDRRYVLKAIIEFNLWTQRAYINAHRKRPDILPSYYIVTKEFGSWVIIKELAVMVSVKKTLHAYMELKKRLGRIPTLEDCQMAGLIIDSVVKIYDGKSGLDKFVESLEEMR